MHFASNASSNIRDTAPATRESLRATAFRDASLTDQVQEFWDRRPCNIRHSPKTLGTREYFDEVEARRYMVEPHIPRFARFERWRGKKVLEVGCGIGTDAICFARAGALLTAVDLSPVSLEIARQRFEIYGLKANFYCGNAEQLSSLVPVEPFDLIYSFGVIHHTHHPGNALAELRKFCGSATELRLMLYSKWSWKICWIIAKYGKGAFWRADELVRTYSEAQTGCPVTFYYSADDVRKLMKDFDILRIRKHYIFPYKVSRYTQYEYEWEWYFRWMPASLFDWLQHHLGWHLLITAKPKALCP